MTAYQPELTNRPLLSVDGEEIFLLPKQWIAKEDERAVTISLICNRRLFGLCYQHLVPELYNSMGKRSGVLIAPFVPIAEIIPEATFPGDIDLLIIPYDGDNLIISETLAIEIKIVRAKFAKQGKAPNEFGFSQSNAMLAHGVPYAAVAHLIVSDTSPVDNWRKMHAARVKNAETGEIGPFKEIDVDMLPADLISRSFGRLRANCPHDALGLLSAYVSFTGNGFWFPEGLRATRNPRVSRSILLGLEKFYENNYSAFLDTPKYPPNNQP